MTSDIYAPVLAQKDSFLKGVTDYMNFGSADGPDDPTLDSEWAADYGQEDIDAASALLDSYLADLQTCSSSEQVREAVEKVVLGFNALNEQTDGNLIETDQREQLCAIIIQAAKLAGLESDHYDITEEWREW